MTFFAGQRLSAQMFNSTFQTAEQSEDLGSTATTTSVGFTVALSGDSSPIFTTCTAPLSGKVKCHWAAGIYLGSGGVGTAGFVLCAPQVREGNSATVGTIFHAAADALAIQNSPTSATLENIQVGRSYTFTGLTPGMVYSFTLAYRVSTGDTGNIIRKTISAIPIPA